MKTFTFDITKFTQEEINLIHAAVSYILFYKGVIYTKITSNNGVVTIATDDDFALSQADIESRIAQHKLELEAADVVEQATVDSVKSQILDATTPEEIDLLLQQVKSLMGS